MKKMLIVLLLVFLALPVFSRGRRESQSPSPATVRVIPSPPQPERYYQTDAQISYQLVEIIDGVKTTVNGMAKYGCKFMSALGIAQTNAGKTLTAHQINSIRQTAQDNGTVWSDMTTNCPATVINMGFGVLGSRLHAAEIRRVTTLERVVEYYDSTIIYGETINGNPHFCEGDGCGAIIYNPYPTAVYREIQGYILIRISGYRLLDPQRSVASP